MGSEMCIRDRVLSRLFGMNGVWSAFPAAEAITLALTVFLLKRPQSVCG